MYNLTQRDFAETVLTKRLVQNEIIDMFARNSTLNLRRSQKWNAFSLACLLQQIDRLEIDYV